MKPETFKAIRYEKNKTQAEFAKELGISKSMVEKIESGFVKVTPRVRMKIAKVFDITDEFIENLEKADKLSKL
ncbi:helix-turn-helix domain-containing protein [Calidifontibacillus erzurumensis]|uniref:Helix-turn-helix transcriptional regulator n=1 Tax=Calidifontibacillus erzurumensis TaxID=2741433 RepID=A0A8J8KC54_9BACI|nr:helix-turn-helix transcriptional regulator [Calidifontibacillus erzurumensis]NSL51713.1 helix-turn-helix transcriptional regulator [Calidifontibacillus erzurumensis]